jgi:hypothetical protein
MGHDIVNVLRRTHGRRGESDTPKFLWPCCVSRPFLHFWIADYWLCGAIILVFRV